MHITCTLKSAPPARRRLLPHRGRRGAGGGEAGHPGDQPRGQNGPQPSFVHVDRVPYHWPQSPQIVLKSPELSRMLDPLPSLLHQVLARELLFPGFAHTSVPREAAWLNRHNVPQVGSSGQSVDTFKVHQRHATMLSRYHAAPTPLNSVSISIGRVPAEFLNAAPWSRHRPKASRRTRQSRGSSTSRW